jgi:hypothetical protein
MERNTHTLCHLAIKVDGIGLVDETNRLGTKNEFWDGMVKKIKILKRHSGPELIRST